MNEELLLQAIQEADAELAHATHPIYVATARLPPSTPRPRPHEAKTGGAIHQARHRGPLQALSRLPSSLIRASPSESVGLGSMSVSHK